MFIISPRIGLCNQLQTIVKGILLAIKYNRNIYIDKFQIDLESNRLADIHDILDINKMNVFLKDVIKTHIVILNTLNTNIYSNLDKYKLPNVNYNNISESEYINDDIELNKHMEIIYLGNIVSLCISKSFNYNWVNYSSDNLYHVIMNNIKFNQIFYKLKDNIKQELNLTNFNCIHLRIEDDAIKCFSSYYNLSCDEYNTELINFYNNNITCISQDKKPIYISSGMLKFDNTININYYTTLMKNNILLCDKSNINLDAYYVNNRELIAIIDLLLAYDSDLFIGSGISSFSINIHLNHIYNKKPSTLLQCLKKK
jgi:hypothetical protein